jgi:hypothetical protein
LTRSNCLSFVPSFTYFLSQHFPRLGPSPANYIGFGLSPAATRKRGPSVDSPAPATPAPATPAPANSTLSAASADSSNAGKSVIAQQLESLWQGSNSVSGADAASALLGDRTAEEVGFVRDENAFAEMAAAVKPHPMRLSMQQLDEV